MQRDGKKQRLEHGKERSDKEGGGRDAVKNEKIHESLSSPGWALTCDGLSGDRAEALWPRDAVEVKLVLSGRHQARDSGRA